jgi:glycerophosphoryl diester phosphodiesterase
MLIIAHRAGNDLNELRGALNGGADIVEADVRYFRGTTEVRHLKTLSRWWLWDHPWELVRRRDATFPTLDDVLTDMDATEVGRLMLDLKGVRRSLPPAVAALLRERAPGAPVAVCTRRWWMLDAFAADPAIRLVISAGSKRELRVLRQTLRRPVEKWPGRRRAFGVSIRRTLLTRDVVEELHQHVERVMTWPVDTPAELAEATELRVSGLIGKNLALLRDQAEPQ